MNNNLWWYAMQARAVLQARVVWGGGGEGKVMKTHRIGRRVGRRVGRRLTRRASARPDRPRQIPVLSLPLHPGSERAERPGYGQRTVSRAPGPVRWAFEVEAVGAAEEGGGSTSWRAGVDTGANAIT